MPLTEQNAITVRIVIIGLILACFFSLVAVRAFFIQVSLKEQWKDRAARQHERTLTYKPHRGVISDRDGYELAVSTKIPSIGINPKEAKLSDEQRKKLAEAIGISESKLESELSKKTWFRWLARHVPPPVKNAVKDLDLEHVEIIDEQKRFYPAGKTAAHVIGFTGVDPTGIEGAEQSLDELLMGSNEKLAATRDGKGRLSLNDFRDKLYEKTHGNNIYLSLDSNLQHLAESALQKGVTDNKAKAGSAIIMDPYSGDILAMASYPDFDPNAIQNYNHQDFRNRAISEMYEPGSTMKSLVLAAAFDEKVVTPESLIDCENGSYYFGGKTIRDHGKKYGLLTASDALVKSSNIAFVKIGDQMGKETLYKYLLELDFGKKTNIGLPGEAKGILRPLNTWYDADLANIAFGQGISTTGIQLATAFTAIANEGRMVTPRLILKVTDPTGRVIQLAKEPTYKNVFSRESASKVLKIMTGVTQEGGTAPQGNVEGTTVAGKTGTSQKYDPEIRAYSRKKKVASFVGIFPADKPKYVIVTIVDEPSGMGYGGMVAAPIFKEIASNILGMEGKNTPFEPNSQPASEDDLPEEKGHELFVRGFKEIVSGTTNKLKSAINDHF